ncbi:MULTISPECIES: GDP-mannose 4,6-dehydratase [unclassified Agrococcus]|uniref:GDP-mannose 4,6-dehydratase n=1 Tax=unclassified Agrococcus TaxID=2615065 RepID=UPI00360DA9D1
MSAERVFVTGASGQDGGLLVARLLADGAEVVALVRAEDEGAQRLTEAGVEIVVGDLADLEGLADAVDAASPSLVVNLGGISSVAESWRSPARTGLVSGAAVAAIVEGAWRVEARTGSAPRLVQASSSEIFGDAPTTPQTEATPIAPVSPYGAAKAYAHRIVQLARARGMHASNAILYNHESPARPMSFVTRKITHGVARIAAGVDDGLALGNLDARRDWGWAPDYVDAMLRMARADVAGDWIVATGEARTVRDFVGAAFAAAGVEDWEDLVTVDPRFVRPADVATMVGDASRLRAELGWAPTVAFDDVVAAMVHHDVAIIGAQAAQHDG